MSYKIGLILLPLLLLSCIDNEDVEPTHLTLTNTEAVATEVSESALLSPSSLCQDSEIAMVSCQMDEPQARLLSICQTNATQKVHYRLGTPDNISVDKTFTEQQPLLRWVDSSAYTTYFGFQDNGQYYSVGVPQETHGAKVFMDAYDQEGQAVAHLSCTSNSFADKAVASPAIIDLSNEDIYNHGINFPYDYYNK